MPQELSLELQEFTNPEKLSEMEYRYLLKLKNDPELAKKFFEGENFKGSLDLELGGYLTRFKIGDEAHNVYKTYSDICSKIGFVKKTIPELKDIYTKYKGLAKSQEPDKTAMESKRDFIGKVIVESNDGVNAVTKKLLSEMNNKFQISDIKSLGNDISSKLKDFVEKRSFYPGDEVCFDQEKIYIYRNKNKLYEFSIGQDLPVSQSVEQKRETDSPKPNPEPKPAVKLPPKSEAPQPEKTQKKDASNPFGHVSREYESSGRSNVVVKDGEGADYGLYQISSIWSMDAFLKILRRNDADAYNRLNKYKDSVSDDQGEFAKEWKVLAKAGRLQKSEHAFAKQMFFDQPLQNLTPELAHKILNSRALEEAFLSTSVQHGPNKVVDLFEEIYAANPGADNEKLITELYKKRGKLWRPGMQGKNARYKRELDDVLALIPKPIELDKTKDFKETAMLPTLDKILFVGDSITQGYIGNTVDSQKNVFEKSKGTNWMLSHMPRLAENDPNKPQAMVLLGGMNDGIFGTNKSKKKPETEKELESIDKAISTALSNLGKIISEAQSKGMKVYVGTYPSELYGVQKFNDELRQKYAGNLIDFDREMREKKGGDLSGVIAKDGVHLTDYSLMNQILMSRVPNPKKIS